MAYRNPYSKVFNFWTNVSHSSFVWASYFFVTFSFSRHCFDSLSIQWIQKVESRLIDKKVYSYGRKERIKDRTAYEVQKTKHFFLFLRIFIKKVKPMADFLTSFLWPAKCHMLLYNLLIVRIGKTPTPNGF